MAFVSTRRAAPILALLAPVIALLTLSACNAERSRFPSLAVRPAERAYGTGQVAAPAPGLPPNLQLAAGPGMAVQAAALRAAALAAHARFTEQQGPAARLTAAARGAAPGTEAWARATIAIAGLQSARSQGMVALADLDRLLIAATEQAATGPDTDLVAIAPKHREVEALLGEEDRAIGVLTGALGG